MERLIQSLREHNEQAREADLLIYADALLGYCRARREVERQGAVVLHPKTGAPIDNPHLRIMQQCSAIMGRYKRIQSDDALAIAIALASQD